jgi:type II secretory pathway component PulK
MTCAAHPSSSAATFSGDRRRRGSVYVAVLAAAMIVTVIGLSALLAARVRHRGERATADFAQARVNALSAIDMGFFLIEQNPGTWRTILDQGPASPLTNQSIGNGSFSLEAMDPVDGDIDLGTDPVLLTGVGSAGQARFKLQVQLDGSGRVVPDSWRQTVD